MLSINGARLMERIHALGEIGKDAEGRRTRLAASDAEKEGRDLVAGWIREAGLELVVDRSGNMFGIWQTAENRQDVYKRQVFICGDENDKLARMQETYKVDLSKAKDIMIKSDKKRSSYYNYYSNKKWGDPRSYDLCLNSSVTGLDGAVDVILSFAEVKQRWNKEKKQ